MLNYGKASWTRVSGSHSEKPERLRMLFLILNPFLLQHHIQTDIDNVLSQA